MNLETIKPRNEPIIISDKYQHPIAQQIECLQDALYDEWLVHYEPEKLSAQQAEVLDSLSNALKLFEENV